MDMEKGFIQEVDEALKGDKRSKQVKKFGLLAIVVTLLVALGVWAYYGWDSYKKGTWKDQTLEYYRISESINKFANVSNISLPAIENEEEMSEEDKKKREQMVSFIEKSKAELANAQKKLVNMSKSSGSSVYLKFASTMKIVQNFIKKGDTDKVRSYSIAFIEDSSNPENLRDLLTIVFARYLISKDDESSSKEAMLYLTPLSIRSYLFKPVAKELEGIARLGMGEYKKAKKIFEDIISMPNVPEDIIRRADVYITNINVKSAG